jgi:D-beta-D-heptose 7-phosphate kinase / D-beta-D-heptose 1-phosphate adenosyltransferase
MTSPLLRTLDRFASKRVLVIGEAMLDCYLFGTSGRLCQEAPVPVIDVQVRHDRPGGAANTALNLATLGCRVALLSAVGDDHEGKRLRAMLRQQGVDTGLLAVSPERQTLAKHRVMNGDALLVRFDQGDTLPVDPNVERHLVDRLDAAFGRADAVVISDYGYGVVTERLLARLRALQERFAHLIAVDARDLARYRPLGVTLVKPNFGEAQQLVGSSLAHTACSRADLVASIGETILERAGSRIAAITLDADGAVVVERGQPPFRTYAAPADMSRTAGAGDTYIAALTLALASGATTRTAAEVAAGAAGVVVARDGTATCSAGDLRRALGAVGAPGSGSNGMSANRGGQGDPTDVGARRAPALHQA